MSKNHLIVGLDVGSSAIKIVVGQLNASNNELYVVAANEVPAMGISKGMVVSIEDVVSSITNCLEQVERVVGQPLNRAYVGVSGTHINTMLSKGVIAVSRADNEITEHDVARVVEAAQTVATPPNYEILHVIPKVFAVDNQGGIKDPLGMTGIRLEVETQIIQGLSAQIKNLTKAVYRTGIEVGDLVLSILATAESCLNQRQKELGVAVVNIGSHTTSVAVFEEGDVLATYILPVGSAHVTADIAIGLRASLDVAEAVKLTYGQAISTDLNKKEEINLQEFDERETDRVSVKYVSEIIEARMQEIFNMVDRKLMDIDRSGLLPAGIVLTGGGAKLPGIVELAKKEFRLPASLGYPENIKSAIDKINDLSYATALGLVVWGYQLEGQHFKNKNKISWENLTQVGASFWHDGGAKIKSWFKSLLP